MTEATPLRILILGPPSFAFNDEPLKIDRLQIRALLYRLAAAQGPVARDHLLFLFWPDVADAQARRHLTQLMSHVRRMLPDPDLLITTKDHVQLDPAKVWSDVVEFERLCALETAEARQQAIKLYRDLLLVGIAYPENPEFEAWLAGERYRIEKMFLDTVRLHVEAHIAHDEHDEAAVLAERYLAIDPLAEEVHRLLMEAYAAGGNRSAALRQYEQCVVLLARELGVEPLPETQALYQSILAGEATTSAASYRPAWSDLPRPDIPLVGRDDLLQELAIIFGRVQARQGQVVLLRGEAGIGKSRLMQEFVTRVQGQALVLVSACYASTQSIPYQPLVEALRPAVGRLSLLRTIPATWLSEASVLLPELRQLSPALAPPPTNTDPQQARSRLLEALFRIVLGLAQDASPVLLCVDDLQWADATTLEWLAYLMRQARRSPLMLMGTFREEEADALAALLHDLSRAGFRAERSVTALANAPISQLLAHLHVDDAALTQRLQDVTGGNPFFLLETLNELLEHGAQGAELAASDALPISANVRETLLRRLNRLGPLSRQVLEASAVQETAFEFDIVRTVAGRSELETVDAVDDLVRRALLVTEGERLRFRHELIRVAVYQELSAWRRRVLHQRVAQVMEDEHAGNTEAVAVQLGHHLELAGRVDRAIYYWQQAGDAATRLYAQAEAVVAYRRALKLAQAGAFLEQLQPLFLSLGRALELDSRFDLAIANYVAMEERAVALGTRTLELHALIAQAVLCTTFNPQQNLLRGEALCARALELAKELRDEAAEAKILWNLIILYSYARRWDEAIACGTRSIAIARRHNLREQLALSLNDLGGHAYEVAGRLDEAQTALDEARTLWRELDNRSMLADNLATAAAIAVWRGEYRHALLNAQEALRISQSIDNLWGQSYSLYKMGWVHWERGRVDLALAIMGESLRLAELAGFVVPQVVTRADLAILYAELGDIPRATAAAQQALKVVDTDAQLFLPYALSALAQVHMVQNEAKHAAPLLARAEEHVAQNSELVYHAPALVARVMLDLQRHEYGQACDDAQRLAQHSVSANRPLAYLMEAQAHLALGARDIAYTFLLEARQAAKTIGSRRVLWRTLQLLSDIEPDRTHAARLRRHATRLVSTIAAYIPDTDLRASFLHTPDVRRLLGAYFKGTLPTDREG